MSAHNISTSRRCTVINAANFIRLNLDTFKSNTSYHTYTFNRLSLIISKNSILSLNKMLGARHYEYSCLTRDDHSGEHGGCDGLHRLQPMAGTDLLHHDRSELLWLPVQRIPRQPPRHRSTLHRDSHGDRQRHWVNGQLPRSLPTQHRQRSHRSQSPPNLISYLISNLDYTT